MRTPYWCLGLLLMASLLLVGCGEPQGMATMSIPSHIEITPPNYSIGVYLDRDCTAPLTNFGWGNMANSQAKTIEVYVRAEGNQPVDIAVDSSLDPQFGYVSCNSLTLSPGEIGLLKITLHTVDEVQIVTSDFRIFIKGCKS